MPVAGDIAGCVEDVSNEDIAGWVRTAEGEDLTRIVITSDLGQNEWFAAHFHRPDIAKLTGAGGINGFAIPRTLLPPFRKRIFFRSSKGRLLDRGELMLDHRTVQNYQKADRLLFMHIPKTAGTSIRNLIERSFRPSAHCWIYEGETSHLSSLDFTKLPQAQQAAFRIVGGHFHLPFSNLVPQPHRLFTIVRNPMERVRSEVLHLYRVVGRHLLLQGRSVALEDAFNEDLVEDNLQTRMISGIPKHAVPKLGDEHLSFAKDVLARRFAFVGVTEHIESDFKPLATFLGIFGRKLGKDNARPETLTPIEEEILNRIDWQAIEERHAVDNKLYQWVKQCSAAPAARET
jgi:hypothetical protein